MISSLFTAFSLGCLYFISAIPVATMAGAPLWPATLVAWLGYSAGGGIIICLGAPLRAWLFKTMNLSIKPNQKKIFWRIWVRYGLVGLGFIAPVTIGPQVAVLFLLAMGEEPKKIFGIISLGALPWAVVFAALFKYGSKMCRVF